MKNLISIKEARIKKGITTYELANALKLNINLIELLDEDRELPKRFEAYRSTYVRSIYSYLGYKLPHGNNFQIIHNDNSKIILTFFFLIFTSIILLSSSFNIYKKFNKELKIYEFEKDEIYYQIDEISSNMNFEKINHNDFLDLFITKKRTDYSQNFIIFSNNLGSIYYKIQNIDKKTIEFGELLQLNKIEFDLNDDFLIDLSNIANIKKIIYRGMEIEIKNNYNFYLKDFNINKLDKLL